MALQLVNRTPFMVQQMPLTERNGATVMRVVVKAAYDVAPDGTVALAKEPARIVFADEYFGQPGASAVCYESDVSLHKPYTDLVVKGNAVAPNGNLASRVEVSLRYAGRMLKTLHVSGDRVWEHGLTGWRSSPPQRFATLPLTYERAFGGCDESGNEPRNLVGVGYHTDVSRDLVGAPLPNVEYAEQLISSPRERPAPAGLGVVARSWQPRLGFAGTYDQRWLDERYPLLPLDFDTRFNQSVASDQWLPRPRGGESIVLTGMSTSPQFRVVLPSCSLRLGARYRDHAEDRAMELDTILVEPDDSRLTLVFRDTLDIHGDPFRLLEMAVGGLADPPPAKPCGCAPCA